MANNNGILSGITMGLSNTYKYFQSEMPDGVTYNGIQEILGDKERAGMVNTTFASYMQSNFNTIDKDGDGIIGADELDRLTGLMTKAGLTKDELTQMYASGASGLSGSTMDMVMKYFDEIDTNKDGRVTSAEISAFGFNSSKQEKMDEYAHKHATTMSTFYADDSADYGGAYSMLSYRYQSSKQK